MNQYKILDVRQACKRLLESNRYDDVQIQWALGLLDETINGGYVDGKKTIRGLRDE